MLSEHDEENDTTGKEINRCTVIRFSSMNFWSHVTFSTELGLQSSTSVPTGYWCCKTKIGNLEIEYLIEEDVFWFKISVSDTLLMYVVKSLNELSEIESCDGFIESSSGSNVVEQFSTSSQFKNNINNVFLFSRCFLDYTVFAVLNQVNNVGVAELTHCVHLSHHQFQELGIEIRVTLLQDHNSEVSAGALVKTKLDF